MTEQEQISGSGTRLALRWPPDATAAALPSNQFLVANGPPIEHPGTPDGSLYLVFGHAAPPLLLNQEALERFAAESDGMVEPQITAALYMTHERATEVLTTLARHLGYTLVKLPE